MTTVCSVSRHYGYTVNEAMKLTPRQAVVMVKNAQAERVENFETLAGIFGVKNENSADRLDDDKPEDLSSYDTSAIDKQANARLEQLKQRQKIRV